jgi:hypothetical protein
VERESLLSILIMVLGGLALQPFASWRGAAGEAACSAQLERSAWLRLWYPIVPLALMAAGLCGWALREPDPVRDPLDPWVVILIGMPFALLFGRAGLRAAWALLRTPPECCVSTVGLIQPQVVFSPFLAKQLDESVIRAALAHERAHARHRDPLRIWLAQLVTDLQWPWPQARRRLDTWLDALELARDDEARERGADGPDLAAAMLASVRFLSSATPEARVAFSGTQHAHARLVGDSRALRMRVGRLLAPLPARSPSELRRGLSCRKSVLLLVPLLLTVLALGFVYGESLVHPLLGLTS